MKPARWSALLGILTSTFGPAALPAQTFAPASRPATFQAASTPLLSPRVTVAFTVESVQAAVAKPVWSGEGVVGPNGSLEIGPYGLVQVGGMTAEQAQATIERALSRYVAGPRVRVTVRGPGVPPRGQSPGIVPAAAQEPEAAPELTPPPMPTKSLIGAPTPVPPGPETDTKPLPTGPAIVVPDMPPPPPAPAPPELPAPPPAPETPDAKSTMSRIETSLNIIQLAPGTATPAPDPTTVTPAPATIPMEWHGVDNSSQVAGAKAGASKWHSVARMGASQHAVTKTNYEQMPSGTEPGSETVPTAPRPVPDGGMVESGSPIPSSGPLIPPGHFHPPDVPRECGTASLPAYVVEPPDILLIQVTPALKDQPIQGQHLVRPDGTINLGIYGKVHVNHMTLDEVRMAVYNQLLQRIEPKALKLENINVDVLAYNSKFYYVITDGAGYGQQVVRFPITGKETVLDAICQIQGLPPVASKCRVWVARPACAPYNNGKDKILPVDWVGVTECARHWTNYQLVPGDRVYVDSQKIICLDTTLQKVFSPIERIFNIVLLGSTTVNSIRNSNGTGTGIGR